MLPQAEEGAAVSPALFLRTFKLMADNMMASVPWLLVTEEMAVNSQLRATPCGKSRNILGIMLHLALWTLAEWLVPPTVGKEIPKRGAPARQRAARLRAPRLRGR